MRLLVSIVALTLFVMTASAAESPGPQQAFDRAFNWLRDKQMVDGLIVSDSDSQYHVFQTTLVEAPPELRAVGIGYYGRDTFDGIPIFVNASQSALLVPDATKINRVTPGHQIPGASQYFLMSIEGGTVTARLSFLYDNTDVANSLLEQFEKTGDSKYLSDAGSLLQKTYSMVDADGKFRLHFVKEGPKYMGMPQGILMQSIDHYWRLSHEKWADDAVNKLSSAYEHTTEGTWDHWSNSVAGMLTGNARGKIDGSLVDKFWKPYLYRLLEQAHYGKGNIPQTMDSANEIWPDYKATYQSFNVMILMRLAKMDPSVRYDVCEEFPLMFNATKDIGGGRYAGRKVVAAELGEELCGGTYAAFIADEFAKLPTDITSIETAIGNMMISAVVTPKSQPKE